jgi:hypothetical protein
VAELDHGSADCGSVATAAGSCHLLSCADRSSRLGKSGYENTRRAVAFTPHLPSQRRATPLGFQSGAWPLERKSPPFVAAKSVSVPWSRANPSARSGHTARFDPPRTMSHGWSCRLYARRRSPASGRAPRAAPGTSPCSDTAARCFLPTTIARLHASDGATQFGAPMKRAMI